MSKLNEMNEMGDQTSSHEWRVAIHEETREMAALVQQLLDDVKQRPDAYRAQNREGVARLMARITDIDYMIDGIQRLMDAAEAMEAQERANGRDRQHDEQSRN